MALYEVQACLTDGTWFDLSYWQLEPTIFRDFLTYFFNLPHHKGCENLLRVKRIPYEWGIAKWEFDGQCHYATCY